MRRVFVLGAGFSAPAGMPLTRQLLQLVLDEVGALSEWGDGRTHLHQAYEEYLEFLEDTDPDEEVDLERFVEWIDHRHLFGMLGSDTWSDEGNRDQHILRWGIARVLLKHSHAPSDLHRAFARRLKAGDMVLTFNYDLLLERAMDAEGIKYRRLPHRYAEVGLLSSVGDADAEQDEVLLLKLHGSVDWISKGPYNRQLGIARALDTAEAGVLPVTHVETADRTNRVFGRQSRVQTHRLAEGPLPPGDALHDVYVIDNLDLFYSNLSYGVVSSPLLLAPSRAKQFYGAEIRDFWRGLGMWGMAWGGLNMIGFSLGGDDNYAKHMLWRLVGGYRQSLEHEGDRVSDMDRIQVVDFREHEDGRKQLQNAYRLLPDEHTDFHYDGLSLASMDYLFPDQPYRKSDWEERLAEQDGLNNL